MEATTDHPSFALARALPEPLRSHFPKTMGEEAQRFEPLVRRRCFGFNVLVVARTRINCAWCAYIAAVPGVDHEIEKEEVLRTGKKLPEDTARTLFPEFDDVRYAR